MSHPLINILEKMKKEIHPTKVVGTHKMTETQKKLWKSYKALAKSTEKMLETALTAKKKFWNKVEGDIENFDSQLKVDDDTWIIEVHEDDCEDCDQDN